MQMKSFYEPDDKDLRLAGLVGIHVDDLNTIGTEKFHRNIIDPLQLCVFGEVENKQYRFTGVGIKETSEVIKINQQQYCNSLQEIKINDTKDSERPLPKDENKQFREALGSLIDYRSPQSQTCPTTHSVLV